MMKIKKIARTVKFDEKFKLNNRDWFRLNPHTDLPGSVAMKFDSNYCISQCVFNGEIRAIHPDVSVETKY
jgi:hypothetical protein